MSVIIRLENLPWEARSIDIRRFFQGLQIPDGTLLKSNRIILIHSSFFF
jgi:hypothetical protein